jgi:Ca2+-binding RTX toxin-like protein
LLGDTAINEFGNELDNELAGNSAANVLAGGLGSNTYLWSPGTGSDIIIENDATLGNTDLIRFGSGISTFQM